MSDNTKTTNKILPSVNRYITTHNTAGDSIYSKEVEEPLDFWTVHTGEGHSGEFELGYVTEGFPVPLAGDEDLTAFKDAYNKKKESGLVKHGGTILRYCNIPPGSRSPMHRTVSLDYGILVTGELECLLDSGESRTVHSGDLVVQRGTMHQWINHKDEWARIVFILFHATPVEIGGTKLEEHQGGMVVPASH
ncbi:hypothetical protein BU24DRAFT_473354 [Aaosphaeria arxii CBS 175.79]|uniref:Cupin type-2 domain-containing protein n=1 Tax=Aaosphaeria arxii CBS 175.79 TaxID=1450172 RepID=A0A6A5XBA1_9PLEO|nr:uncharacterized protein BU24DRAFT_473354 [Aaosphaeria arxii CBS 175.79]KAF2010173.1 hypothetical protein BU24DRAFT_473354 [Aaosphaeria arxii CBS 175.79]